MTERQYKRGENPRSLQNLGKPKTKAGKRLLSLTQESLDWLASQKNASAAVDQLILEQRRKKAMAIATVVNELGQKEFDLISLTEGVFNEDTGWTWVLRHSDGQETEYRTNSKYEGLYSWTQDRWTQIRGNGQFSLPRNREKAITSICQQMKQDEYSRRIL